MYVYDVFLFSGSFQIFIATPKRDCIHEWGSIKDDL